MKTLVLSNRNFNKTFDWAYQPRGLQIRAIFPKSESQEVKTFTVKYFSKRKKYTSPVGCMKKSFEEVKAAARQAGYDFVKMGSVCVAI